jgi:hypothetical protein
VTNGAAYSVIVSNGAASITSTPAAVIVGGAPVIVTQPANRTNIVGTLATFSVTAVGAAPLAYQWRRNGTNLADGGNIAGATTNELILDSVLFAEAGTYSVVVSNLAGRATSLGATLTAVSAPIYPPLYTLSPIWGAIPGNGSYPYVTSNGGANTPGERSFAYHALSNQLIIVHCPPSSTAFAVYVVDAATGASLYTLKTNGVIHEGSSEVSGSNPIDLLAAAVADDGAVYICNETPNASGGASGETTKMLHVYRWANSGPNTTPIVVYRGDPSGVPPGTNERWGDVMTVRGSGTNTELFLNSKDGLYGAVLRPTNSAMAYFTNYWSYGSAGDGSIGRSVQFGATNTVLEKRKGGLLFRSAYSLNNQTNVVLSSVSFSNTLGGVFVDSARNLAAGVDFVGTAGQQPDAVALYDISDPQGPVLLGRHSFPVNQVANANFICQTVIAGGKVFSLDANNGLMAFYLNAPSNSMVLNLASSGINMHLSWGNSAAVLQGTPSLRLPVWTDLTIVGQTNSVQPVGGQSQFYRLVHRR